MTKASTELEPRQGAGQVAVRSDDVVALHEVREALISGAPVPEIDADQIAEAITRRLLEATDLDQIMNPKGRDTSEKWFDVPVTLRGAVFMPSDIEEAKVPVYAVLDVVDDNGEPHIWTCGARGLVVQLLHLREQGALPRKVMLVRVGKPKPNRSQPIYLQDVAA